MKLAKIWTASSQPVLTCMGRQCLSHYQVGVNQDKDIQVDDTVRRIDPLKMSVVDTGPKVVDISAFREIDQEIFKVTAINASLYPEIVTFDLEGNSEANSGKIVKNVKREEISTSSFDSLHDLSFEQRSELFKSTTGFLFDYASQADYEAMRSTILGYFSTSAFISGNLVGGGFTADVPVTSVDAFDKHASYLKRFAWIDEKTQAIEVAFNMYNVNLDVVIVSQALFELTPGGLVMPHYAVKVTRLCDNWRAHDKTREQIELVCLLIAALMYCSVVLRAFHSFVSYEPVKKNSSLRNATETTQGHQRIFSSDHFGDTHIRCNRCCLELGRFWSVLEFLLVTALAFDFWMRRRYQSEMISLSVQDLFGSKYVDLRTAANRYNTSINLSSLVMFLTIFKCFK